MRLARTALAGREHSWPAPAPARSVHFAADLHTAGDLQRCRTEAPSGSRGHVKVESREGVAIFRLMGVLDSSAADETRRALAPVAQLGKVLFDLTGVIHLAPAGIGVLMGAVRRIQEAHGTVVLVAPPGDASRVLVAAGAAHLADVVDTGSLGLRLLSAVGPEAARGPMGA